MSYLYSSIVTKLDITNQGSKANNDTSTFVSADQRKLGRYWPIAVDGVKISVTDTRIFDVDENLIWAGLSNRNLFIDNS